MRTLVRAGRLLRFNVEHQSHAIVVQYPLQLQGRHAEWTCCWQRWETGSCDCKGGGK